MSGKFFGTFSSFQLTAENGLIALSQMMHATDQHGKYKLISETLRIVPVANFLLTRHF